MFIGIGLGLLVLGLMVLFSIVLPEATNADEGTERPALTLPDTLPGGYAAADRAESFKGGQLEDQADAIAKQQAASTSYGNEVMPQALGTSAVTRSYVVHETQAVFVQVFDAEGGAFSPSSLTDPETTDGAGGITMRTVGDGACILTTGQTDPAADVQTASQCQVSRDGLTVQLSSDVVAADDLVDVADDVLEANAP
jgi:hypothetical protein